MNIDPQQLQAIYSQFQQNPQMAQGMMQQMPQGMPQQLAQALQQFQSPSEVDPMAQKYGIQPGPSLI